MRLTGTTTAGASAFRSQAARLAAWWVGQWNASVPDALRASLGASRRTRLVIRVDEGHVAFALLGAAGVQIFFEQCASSEYTRSVYDGALRRAANEAGPSGLAVSLQVQGAVAGSLLIPDQARGSAADILADHIARRMPVSPEEVFAGYDLAPAGRGKLQLQYVVVPQARLDRCMAVLGLTSSEIDMVERAAQGDSPAVAVPTMRVVPKNVTAIRRTAGMLVVLAGLSAIVGFCALAWRQSTVIADLDRQIAETAAPTQAAIGRLRRIYGMISPSGVPTPTV